MFAEYSYRLGEPLKALTNQRLHHFERSRVVAEQREIGALIAYKLHRKLPLQKELRRRVTFVRVSPRKLDDDNNVTAFKGIRDGFAKWTGINDRDGRWEWRYEQAKGEPGIVIRLERVE